MNFTCTGRDRGSYRVRYDDICTGGRELQSKVGN